jgi:hypothetical protein
MMSEAEFSNRKIAGDNIVPLESIGDFVISLIQAFLRTGYYLPEHPESRKAKSGLYEKFTRLVSGSGEVSFLLKEEHGLKIISIEGVQPESIRLAALMTKGMSDTYNPRFAQYLERKEIISLSLSSRMDNEEFSRFIDVMSEPSLTDMRGMAAKDTFVASLKEMGVHNLSFVFREDFISMRPGIPWRVGMALSRLRKDLRMAPIFRNLTVVELQQVRKEILHDILRPISNPDLVYAFLMNIDLAATEELSEEEGEDVLLGSLRDHIIPALAERFMLDITGKKPVSRAVSSPEKISRLVNKISLCLKIQAVPEAKNMLEEMCHSGLLPFEELPSEIRDKVLTARLVANFLARRDSNLADFDAIKDPNEYVPRVKALVKIILYLLDKGNYIDGIPLAETIASHSQENSARGQVARSAFSWIDKHSSLDLAAEAFAKGSKSDRLALGRFFLLLGKRSIPHLLQVIRESNDLWCSKIAAEHVIQFGTEAAIALVKELEQGKLSPEAMAAIIRILREVPEKEVTDAFLRVIGGEIDNSNPEVRRETLFTLGRLAPREYFDQFRTLIEDADLKIRKIAVRGLGMSGDPRAFEPIAWCLENAEKGDSDEEREMAAPAIEALGMLSRNCPVARDSVVRLMKMLAEQATSVGRWQKLLGRSLSLPPDSLLMLAENLLPISRSDAQKVAAVLTGNRDRVVVSKAEELLKKMEKE